MQSKLRIGIVNLMPRAELYEPGLLGPLEFAELGFEPLWIRLSSHRYSSSDAAHIARNYRAFDAVIADGPLDGLILTGAPVEELAFEQITYWHELQDILSYAQAEVTQTLGLCWGGLALAEQLGIAKSNYERKLFGVYELRTLEPEHALLRGSDDVFMCPQSRHAGIADAELERAAADGRVRLLAHGAASGYAVFEARDGRYLMHLGHPEYDAARLVYEYRRDVALGRTDVPVPAQLDLDNPITRWRSHRNQFFRNWLLNLRK